MDKLTINKRVIEVIDMLLNTDKDLNKTLLAESLGVKPAKFSEILKERMNAGTDIMNQLCIKYKISPDYILTGRGEIKEKDKEEKFLSSDKLIEMIDQKDKIIREQAEEIGRLKAEKELYYKKDNLDQAAV